MKANYIGIVAGILAFVSIALPWWTMTMSFGGVSASGDLYLWGTAATGVPGGGIGGGTWWTYGALAFAVIGGILGLVGGFMATRSGKMALLGAGILIILAIVIFIAGFYSTPGGSTIIFYSAGGITTYLSYGFWLALVAAIIAFVAYAKHSIEGAAPPPAPA